MGDENIIYRKEVAEKLQDYIDGRVSLEFLQNWELELHRNHVDFDDWEGDNSLTNEILHKIDMSDIDGFSIEEAKGVLLPLDPGISIRELVKN